MSNDNKILQPSSSPRKKLPHKRRGLQEEMMGKRDASLTDLLGQLQGVKQSGKQFVALCPAHEDKKPSLSIAQGDDGRILIKCFAGCEVREIVSALGLKMSDLFAGEEGMVSHGDNLHHCNTSAPLPISSNNCDQSDTSSNREDSLDAGITLNAYAQAKKLPVEFLQGLGIQDFHFSGKPAIRIPYSDQAGIEIAVRFRTGLFKMNMGERFRWRKGSKPTLYGLWRLPQALQAGYVILVEGESDCHTLWFNGIPALGLPGAANWNEQRDSKHFGDIPVIYVLIEPDTGGEAVCKWLRRSVIRDRVRIIRLEDVKDPSDLHVNDPDSFQRSWKQAVEKSIPWEVFQKSEAEKARIEAWPHCEIIARDGAILDRFAQELKNNNVVGEDRLAKIIYLALTSRLLDRPVSIAVKGPSSAGKSFLTQQVLKYFPQEAYYALSAMSPKSLAYSREPISHRFLVLYEAAGIGADVGEYLIRTLLSEGEIRYETVEKTQSGFKPVLIAREGPTGLLVTTTAVHLHPENETRLLSVTVRDTPEQTREVLLALAGSPSEPDTAPWHAF